MEYFAITPGPKLYLSSSSSSPTSSSSNLLLLCHLGETGDSELGHTRLIYTNPGCGDGSITTLGLAKV